MDHLEQELDAAVAAWQERGWPTPTVMTVSGSGLATDLGAPLEGPHPWSDVLPFELVEPTPGRVVLSSRGRLHYSQGYSVAQAVFIIRLGALLGVETLIMTNSSGGLHDDHAPGDLVLVTDHLNLTNATPLWGRLPEAWGPQFPDMSNAYDAGLRELLADAAERLGIPTREGVYAGLRGPSYETPAEVRMLRDLGADVVGMSTVLEVIAARHMGLRCACVSVVANPAAGVTDEVLDHADVIEQGAEAARNVRRLFEAVLGRPDWP